MSDKSGGGKSKSHYRNDQNSGKTPSWGAPESASPRSNLSEKSKNGTSIVGATNSNNNSSLKSSQTSTEQKSKQNEKREPNSKIQSKTLSSTTTAAKSNSSSTTTTTATGSSSIPTPSVSTSSSTTSIGTKQPVSLQPKEDDKKRTRSPQSNRFDSYSNKSESVTGRGTTTDVRKPLTSTTSFDGSRSFNDDSRLSKLMKRVIKESDKDRKISAARQLKEFLHTAEGFRNVSKSNDDILGALQGVFYERSYRDVKIDIALCIGMVGSMAQDMQSYFEWLFNQMETNQDDEIKAFYLMSLLETLRCDERKHSAADLIGYVMERIWSLLENADTPDLLRSVVDVILYIAKVHPHVFTLHFRDTVDILVGWHIDSTQKESLISYTSEALVSFRKFWMADVQFSVTLLGQFLEDMEAYSEDLVLCMNDQVNGEEELPTIEECVTKISSLLRVFTTVLNCLGDSFTTNRGGRMSLDEVINIQERVIRSIESVSKSLYSECVLIAANNCLEVLMNQIQTGGGTSSELLLNYIVSIIYVTKPINKQLIISTLSFIKKIIKSYSTKLPVPFLTDILQAQSLLRTARFSQSQEVINELMSVYHTLLGLKNVPLLEETYRLMLCDIEIAYNTLLSDHVEERISLTSSNHYTDIVYTYKQAELVIIFNTCAITEITNTKSNLFGMWALTPSVFDLLVSELKPTNSNIASTYPAVQYSIVHTLYSHCIRHDFFISSSEIVASYQSENLVGVSQATKHYLDRILVLIHKLLMDTHTSYDTRCLCLKWVSDLVNPLQTSLLALTCPQFLAVIKAVISQGYNKESNIYMTVCQCLINILKTQVTFHVEITQLCLELCVYRLSDINKDVRDYYTNLLVLLPLNVSTSIEIFEAEEEGLANHKYNKSIGITTLWLARRSHMSRTPLGTFHSHNFRHVISFILHNTSPSQLGVLNWLQAMYHASQRSDKDTDKTYETTCLQLLIDGNESLLWSWATWEAAQFCILSRLRTPLGKPQDTFTTIEGVLKQFALEVTDNTGVLESTKGEKQGEYTCLKRVQLLMYFMENLEKILYNAYEGCTVAMPAIPKTVKTFFRTNRGTCEEWLTRIRKCVITTALNAGMSAMAVRHAFQLLKDMAEAEHHQTELFDKVLVQAVQAMIDLKSPECIIGLYNWCRESCGRKLPWMRTASDIANRKFESAVKDLKIHVTSIVEDNDDNNDKIEDGGNPKQTSTVPVILGFLSSQITDCYMELNDWKSVIEWQAMMNQYRTENTLTTFHTAFNSTVDLNYIHALGHFDEGKFSNVKESLELIPGASITDCNITDNNYNICWNPQQEIHHIHQQFIRASTILQDTKSTTARSDAVKCLLNAERLAEGLLHVNSFEWPPAFSPQLLTELGTISTLRQQLDEKKQRKILCPMSDDSCENDCELDSLLQILRLIKIQLSLTNTDKNTELLRQLSRVHINAASVARKQGNFIAAEKLLIRQVTLLKGHSENGHPPTPKNLIPALGSLRESYVGGNQLDILKIDRESCKLLNDLGETKASLDILSGTVINNMTSGKDQDPSMNYEVRELSSRSLLTLVKWLQVDSKNMNGIISNIKMVGSQGDGNGICIVGKNIQSLLEIEDKTSQNNLHFVIDGDKGLKIGSSNMISDSDAVIGRLLHLSTIECPELAKSWFLLANWCYKWGRKAVDNASHGSMELSLEEKNDILNALPNTMPLDECEKVISILSQVHSPVSNEEDISDQDQSLYDDGTETTRKQLISSCQSLQSIDDNIIDSLLLIWQRVVSRVYYYYQLSAISYFKYLQLNRKIGTKTDNEDSNVIATLRLLRLLVKHAWELRTVLETGLAETPTNPWKGIIPQLFSRLSHPESYVRQSVSDLLCRVAQDAPHLIVYPAVVGSTVTTTDKVSDQSGILNEYLSEKDDVEDDENSQGDEGDIDDDPTRTILQSCLTAIVDTLSHHYSQMILEVQHMVQELRRITVLWDELWLGTLNQHHQDVVRRLSQLDNEVKKVNNNHSLSKEEKTAIIREKHRTIMKPTLYTMERLDEITCQQAETNHEKWFQETYGQLIKDALKRLKNPPNPSNPNSTWQLFKQIHSSLQQRAQKRNSLILRIQEISPKLSAIESSVIPMPGLGVIGQVITIDSVCNTAQILPTKTKPKKLIFLGSDGRKYPYLFKGLEDLHLDERIMQFLSIVNNMFANSKQGSHQLYRARHYSVTPLGPRSGLIQWVEGATPLFGLYKKWQQREALAQTMKNTGTSTNTAPNISRPSEVFYNKLTPALKDKGIDTLDNRKEWPLNILVKVLQELMEETPADLLARELWCSSTGASEWWLMTKTYSRSVAVMSMIGYIIGLGDRHLDNVLVDLATGEVVHIDYNVCFEKGKGLRVPERVPFRMTPNIQTALGLTGVEGMFRIASEHVLKTMRKGRETLLTLLEAFVYDPLVDWTTGNEGGYTGAFYGGGTLQSNQPDSKKTRKELEQEITSSMFSIRIAEMKALWNKNRDELVGSIPKLLDCIDKWLDTDKQYTTLQQHTDCLQSLSLLIKEALKNKQHNIYTLQDRYGEYSVVKSTQDSAQHAVEETITELGNWQEIHKHVIGNVQGSAIQSMCLDVTGKFDMGVPSFTAATDFLHGAGQSQMVSQSEELESELNNHLQQRRALIHSTLETLVNYNNMISQFGSQFALQCRTSQYLIWLQELLCCFTSQQCDSLLKRFQEEYGVNSNTHLLKTQLIVSTETTLQAYISEYNSKMMKLIERRALETVETGVLEMQLYEGENDIKKFVQENGMCGVSSLVCMIVTALCSLNKRYLLMEGAAAGAGDRLMDLTSRDGDWFLDELCSMSGNVNMFLMTLKNNMVTSDMENFKELHHALSSTHNSYVALQELNINFRTVILPETLKLIQSQDQSFLQVLTELETMVCDINQPLDKVLIELENLHRNAVLGIENDNIEIVGTVKRLEKRFNSLLQQKNMNDMPTGQMLLMGFNGLFTRLEDEFNILMEAIDHIILLVPESWKKIDAVRDAKALQLSSFTSGTRNLLSAIFFVRRLQAMQEFFHMVTQYAAALQGLDVGVSYDDDQLAKPVKKFIAEYVRKQIIGFPSQILGYLMCVLIDTLSLNVSAEIESKDIGAESKVALDELCKKGVDICLRDNQFQHVHLMQATSLTTGYDSAWRKHDLARRLDSNIRLLQSTIQRTTLQLARYQWLHEDIFIRSGRPSNQLLTPHRSTIMSDIRKSMQSLSSEESLVLPSEEKYFQHEESIAQRLRWAAGANPNLNLILIQFEETSQHRKTMLAEERKRCTDIINWCQGILHFEASRTRTSEAISSDNNFHTLIKRCMECCVLMETCNSYVTPLELQLVEKKPLKKDGKVDNKWLEECLEVIDVSTTENKTKHDKMLAQFKTQKISCQDKVNDIKAILSSHHKLMSDIRSILKSLAKQEETEYGEVITEGGIRQYLVQYKTFSESLSLVLKGIIQDEEDRENMKQSRVVMTELLTEIPQIYDNLIDLAPPLITLVDKDICEFILRFLFKCVGSVCIATKKIKESDGVASPGRKPSSFYKDTVASTPPNSSQNIPSKLQSTPVVKKDKIARDPRTGKAIQERNTYAVGVWRRVKMKLDGRDPDINKRLSVAEQVDYVIKDATNIENLALLYEGWTPWV
ncbi:hypothetical protein LOTGIDRAFT_229624 [Lottia gigantea]|uniref:non-specific serine/threonine protein kinase n=1 Tax=Lottia gigantea TaxID=225164 RepID=V3ZNS5_LOTGI|nr:hypothetical protein LOTGIDRAFT_229624 [Lottia gigantea]ESO84130.1 hypothetical protein LOTGIDRAFT_229624 [Lottia gigantea]